LTRVEKIIGPLPGLPQARAISIFAIIAGAILCGFSLFFGFRGETFMGRPLGGDFVQFYAAGKILNSSSAEKIYDIPTIVRVEHESCPQMVASQMLIFGSPPYIAELFRPLALLPYRWAYTVWLAISLALYTISLNLLLPPAIKDIGFLMALASPLFLLETWIGGQISVIAFFGVCLFIRQFRKQRWFAAGLALAIACYKPSLIAVPAAMFLIGGCWRIVAGLLTGTGAAALASFATGAIKPWLDTLRVFGALATGDQASIRRIKYVDFNSFFSILMGANEAARLCAILAIAGALFWLTRAWWRHADTDRTRLLAATFALMLAANFYVPIYDAIILIAAVALAWESKPDARQFQLWLLALVVVPFLTQSFAEFARVQLLTPVLAAFGLWLTGKPAPVTRPDYARPAHSLR
jgi:Glycosyltransferase family 87